MVHNIEKRSKFTPLHTNRGVNLAFTHFFYKYFPFIKKRREEVQIYPSTIKKYLNCTLGYTLGQFIPDTFTTNNMSCFCP